MKRDNNNPNINFLNKPELNNINEVKRLRAENMRQRILLNLSN